MQGRSKVTTISTDASSGYFRRVVGRIHVAMAKWRETPNEQYALAELRDAFAVLSAHSAANQVSHLYDLSKGVTNLLGRLLDGSVEYDDSALVLFDDVTEYIGAHWNSFALKEEKHRDRLNLLLERTDLFASGGFDFEDDGREESQVGSELDPVIGITPTRSAAFTVPASEEVATEGERKQEVSISSNLEADPQDANQRRSLRPSDNKVHSGRVEPRIATAKWIERLVTETLEIGLDEVDLAFKSGTEEAKLCASLAEHLEPSIRWLLRLTTSQAEVPEVTEETVETELRPVLVEADLSANVLKLVLHPTSYQPESTVAESPELALHPDHALNQMPSELSAQLIRTGSTIEFVPTDSSGKALVITVPTELPLLECRLFVSDADAYLVPENAVIELCEDRSRWRLQGSCALVDGKSSYTVVAPRSTSQDHWGYQGTQTKSCLLVVVDGARSYAFAADSIGPSLSVPVSTQEGRVSDLSCSCTLEDGGCALLLDLTSVTTQEDQASSSK